MPRYQRVLVPDYPHHVMQRGHDRKPVFPSSRHFQFYLQNLLEQKRKWRIQVLGYCLMLNHVHLILRPTRKGEDISSFMRVMAARQTRFFNRLESRTGTLWESRFKCSIIATDEYFQACTRYVDLNPVRACIVDDPKLYRWSSYRGLAGYRTDPFLDERATYRLLNLKDRDPDKRYQSLVEQGLRPDELSFIRGAIQRNQLTGSKRFIQQIERQVGIRIENRPRGRPKK